MKEQIQKHLSPDYPWVEHFHFYDTIDSTNTRLKELARNGAPHGTVIAADLQTGGRGRLGRSFLSPPGVGIYMSILLRPDCQPSDLMHLTCASAAAMCDAIEASAGFRPGIKWTNDVVFQQRKLAGILTELGLSPNGSVDYAVIGIGVNCCQQLSDFSPEIRSFAGSLSMFSPQPVDRSLVAAEMMNALWKMDANLLSGKNRLMDLYRKSCITLGQRISLLRGDEIRYGKALDISDDGALIVAFDSGSIETVNSGEVSIRGMYGYV